MPRTAKQVTRTNISDGLYKALTMMIPCNYRLIVKDSGFWLVRMNDLTEEYRYHRVQPRLYEWMQANRLLADYTLQARMNEGYTGAHTLYTVTEAGYELWKRCVATEADLNR